MRSFTPVVFMTLGALTTLMACERAPEPAAPQAAPPAPRQQAQPAPSLPVGLHWIDGPGVLSAVRAGPDRGVLVNVWASWCGNCKKEMPMLLSVAESVREHGVGLMLVSADEPDKAAEAVSFMQEHGGGREAFLVKGRLGPFKRALHPTWKGSIPSTFLFDRSGILRHTWLGPVYEHELQPVLQSFIAGTLEGDGLGLR